jgi:hypothetical protein
MYAVRKFHTDDAEKARGDNRNMSTGRRIRLTSLATCAG